MAARPQALRELFLVAALLISLVASADVQVPSRRATRIVSLVPALTEMLFAIGAGRQVIAISSYDRYPPEAQGLPRVGALLDPDTERIFSLRPDLVITYGSQLDLQTQLQRTGIPIFEYHHAGLTDVTATIRRLGAVTGRTADAERVAGSKIGRAHV